MTEAEAYAFTVAYLRRGLLAPADRDSQSDLERNPIEVERLIGSYISDHEPQHVDEWRERVLEMSPVFMSALWELCLLGVLRPGFPDSRWQGASNNHYSITESGKQWLRDAGEFILIPVDYDSFSTLLQPFAEFSPAFFERARDAALCWKAQAYFACCAMTGAAAEAILLSAASAKIGDSQANSIYTAKSGRSKIESIVVGQAKSMLKQSLQPLFGFISYWRDAASHGAASGLTRNDAITALRGLFYYAKIVHENWSELTTSNPPAG